MLYGQIKISNHSTSYGGSRSKAPVTGSPEEYYLSLSRDEKKDMLLDYLYHKQNPNSTTKLHPGLKLVTPFFDKHFDS